MTRHPRPALVTLDPFDPHMNQDEKAERARTWAECPHWCTGTTHDDGSPSHSGPASNVGAVSVLLRQHGVQVYGDDWAEPLTLEQVDALIEVLQQARATFAAILEV